MDSLLLVLKVLGVLAAAGFGIVGTIHDFKDKKGRLTKWGRVSIVGASLSAVVAVASQLVEETLRQKSAVESARQTAESVKRMERIVDDLSRSMQPLDRLAVTFYWIGLPFNDQRLASYRKRLDQEVSGLLAADYKDWGRWHDRGVVAREYDMDRPARRWRERTVNGKSEWFISEPDYHARVNKVSLVEVTPLSPAAPDVRTEPLAHQLTWIDGFRIIINKVPVAPSSLQDAFVGDIVGTLSGLAPLRLVTIPNSNGYYLRGSFTASDWRNKTGTILTIPDLAGAQLLIVDTRPQVNWAALSTSYQFVTRPGDYDYSDLRSTFAPGPITIAMGARHLEVPESMIKRHVHHTLGLIWEYRFPSRPF